MAKNDQNTLQAHAEPPERVLGYLRTDLGTGLSQGEVSERRERYGRNRIEEAKRRGPFDILLDQFKSLVVLLLLGTSVAALIFDRVVEAIAVAVAPEKLTEEERDLAPAVFAGPAPRRSSTSWGCTSRRGRWSP